MGQPNPHQGCRGWYCWAGTRHCLFCFLLLSQPFVLAGDGKAGKAVGCRERGVMEATVGSMLEMPSNQNISISTKPCPLTQGVSPFQREQRRDLASCPFSRPLIRFVLKLMFHRKAWK